MHRPRFRSLLASCILLGACGSSGGDGTDATTDSADSTEGTETDGDGTDSESEDDGTDDGTPKLDVGPNLDMPAGDVCKVADDGDAPGPCDATAPPDSFEPDVQWSFEGENGDEQSMVIPLVANLTDDNDDGEIDLCDVPDIIVVAFANYGEWNTGHLYAVDGATGAVHWDNQTAVDAITAPALGDIDGDGLVEIVTRSASNQLVAFEHDGTLKWTGANNGTWGPALGMADFDGDGAVEIFVGNDVFDADGNLSWQTPVNSGPNPANTAADVDGDGELEYILGHAAINADGSLLWETQGVVAGYPAVGDLDLDGKPEILITSDGGVAMLEGEDGTIVFNGETPNGDAATGTAWRRPATIHDFDGDDEPEWATSSRDHYSLFEADLSVVWIADVIDSSGTAAGTAFDFLGDGSAEAMYADEFDLFIYDDMGGALLTVPRSSGTGKEYPIVADVDNDASAEIVVVSNASYMGQPQSAPLLQVIRDEQDRWIPARRIWNQHTYHVTNVREDGTIPAQETPAWEALNTFRTQAQIAAGGGGGVCEPEG